MRPSASACATASASARGLALQHQVEDNIGVEQDPHLRCFLISSSSRIARHSSSLGDGLLVLRTPSRSFNDPCRAVRFRAEPPTFPGSCAPAAASHTTANSSIHRARLRKRLTMPLLRYLGYLLFKIHEFAPHVCPDSAEVSSTPRFTSLSTPSPGHLIRGWLHRPFPGFLPSSLSSVTVPDL